MKHMLTVTLVTIGLVVAQSAVHHPATAQGAVRYRVRITNPTNAQTFTPVLAATHSSGATMFIEGTRASAELRALAEGGDVAPLMMLLSGNPAVADIQATGGLLRHEASTKFETNGGGASDRLSLAAILIPTNDAFLGVNTTPRWTARSRCHQP